MEKTTLESNEWLRELIRQEKGKSFATYTELAEKSGVNQGNLSCFMKDPGDKNRRESMNFDSAWKILKFLGLGLSVANPFIGLPFALAGQTGDTISKSIFRDDMEKMPRISRIGKNAPKEIVQGENLPLIPVLGSTGAGDAVEIFDQTPELWLPVLPQYARHGVVGLIVEGDSMEPTITKGAFVGIIPYDGSISEGGIYLIHRPPFGRTIKRIKMGMDNQLLLVSDNASYPPMPVSDEGYEKIILGRIIWIWQGC